MFWNKLTTISCFVRYVCNINFFVRYVCNINSVTYNFMPLLLFISYINRKKFSAILSKQKLSMISKIYWKLLPFQNNLDLRVLIWQQYFTIIVSLYLKILQIICTGMERHPQHFSTSSPGTVKPTLSKLNLKHIYPLQTLMQKSHDSLK